ncbi:hypothetical protein SAMN06296386_10476 [Lachnospiraceae bacterium]|nr:hypothetical protein SAMN06296386_10476 [Lachnospiraceae bacterium]
MASRIEQIIEEIQDYIDECKYSTFSSTKILVNKEEIDELLHELKSRTPDEIKRYQKIISNKEAIMDDAKQKADALIKQAQSYSDQMVNEHTIMQQAYEQASEVVNQARQQAQEIVASANAQAEQIQVSIMQYADDTLATIQNLLSHSITETQEHDAAFINSLNQILMVVNSNRAELHPEEDLAQNEAIADRAEAERTARAEVEEAQDVSETDNVEGIVGDETLNVIR